MPDTPSEPTIEDALDVVLRAAADRRLVVDPRALQRARILGYPYDAICDAIVDGTVFREWVEPHDKILGKNVLIRRVYCYAPQRDDEDFIYSKFVLGEPPLLIRWKLDGSPA